MKLFYNFWKINKKIKKYTVVISNWKRTRDSRVISWLKIKFKLYF